MLTKTPWKVFRLIVDETDLHQSEKSDPDPHQSKN
jgi:hypothetical protein